MALIWNEIDCFSIQFSLIVAAAGTLILLVKVFGWKRSLDKGTAPPSVGSLPIFGSMFHLPDFSEFHKYFLDKARIESDVMACKLGTSDMVVLSSHRSIHEALVKHSTDSADRPKYYVDEFLNPQNKGLIDCCWTPSVKRYHQLSMTILRELGYGRRIMEERIALEVANVVEDLKALQGHQVDPKSILAGAALGVIGRVLLGDGFKDDPAAKEALMKASKDIIRTGRELFPLDYMRALRFIQPYRSSLKQAVEAQDILFHLIDNRISEYARSSHKSFNNNNDHLPECFIDLFLKHEGADCDLSQLRYIIRDMLLPGFESSSLTLLWIILILANNQDVQERAFDEISAVIPGDTVPTLDQKGRLPYVEAVILEAMRYKTLIPLGSPRRTSNNIIVNGYTIPKDCILMVNLYASHMDENIWDQPDQFKPERFLDQDETTVINKDKVVSFSLGKRSCPGELLARQEIFLFLTRLLQQFSIRPPEGIDQIEFKEIIDINMVPTPFFVRFIPRTTFTSKSG